MSTLYDIGVKHGTDKATISASSELSYLHIYERLFATLDQYQHIKIPEISVRGGNSVNMWLECFPNASLVGLDIMPCDFEVLDPERFEFHQGDQNDPELLSAICKKHQSFDLIIDDGSHLIDDYIGSFYALFPALRRTGFYVIEDLYNNYQEWNIARPTKANGKGEAFEAFQNFLVKNIHLGCAYDYSSMQPNVFSLQHFPGFMVLTKGLV